MSIAVRETCAHGVMVQNTCLVNNTHGDPAYRHLHLYLLLVLLLFLWWLFHKSISKQILLYGAKYGARARSKLAYLRDSYPSFVQIAKTRLPKIVEM